FKALLLIVVAVGALKLLHKDVAAILHDWIVAIRVDPDNRWIHAPLERLGIMSDRDLKAISAGSFFSAALLSLEAIGLLFRKHWAEYMTVVLTASLIPFEVYAIAHRVTMVKIIVTLLNVAIVAYLIARLWRERELHKRAAALGSGS